MNIIFCKPSKCSVPGKYQFPKSVPRAGWSVAGGRVGGAGGTRLPVSSELGEHLRGDTQAGACLFHRGRSSRSAVTHTETPQQGHEQWPLLQPQGSEKGSMRHRGRFEELVKESTASPNKIPSKIGYIQGTPCNAQIVSHRNEHWEPRWGMGSECRPTGHVRGARGTNHGASLPPRARPCVVFAGQEKI